MSRGRRCCPIAGAERRSRSTKVAGLKLPSSYLSGGTWYREKSICGLRSRQYGVVQSIARSVPFGEPMVSILANVPQTW